jgi:hypothetical protein
MCESPRPFACAVGGRGEGAWGRLPLGAEGRLGGRVRPDKHFFAWTGAALPTLPEAPGKTTLSRLVDIYP